MSERERREEQSRREAQDDFAGYQVYDTHYEKIGKVDDVFVGENDDPEYIGVKIGLLDTKTTLIPVEIVRVNDKRQLVEVAVDKDAVEKGPTFGDDREITPEFERQVISYYGVGARRTSGQRGAHGAYHSDSTGQEERLDPRPNERTEARERSSERRSHEECPAGASREEHSHERRSGKERPASAPRGGRDENDLRIQRAEEELRVGTREREACAMRVRKRVRTERERLAVPKKREEVRVDRVPVEGWREEAPEVDIGEDEVSVPVVEEEVVVEKRAVVKEEIRVRKDVVQDEEVVEEDVRKEEVDVDDQTTGRRDR